MISEDRVVKEVRAALEREPRVNLHHCPVGIDYVEGVVILEGETESIAGKKLALELAAAVPGVTGIVDRLRVAPAEQMEDGAIRDHVCDALIVEPVYNDYTIRVLVKEAWETAREVQLEPAGAIEVEVTDGVVTLNGRVGSLSHKRLAGVLAWWVPGSRDVVNGLEVVPPMGDNDDEVRDAVRLVLEKDPFVNASQIRITCRDCVVTLDGVVTKPKERDMAEADAWYVFGVDRVINNLEVVE
ncbi:MAG: transport-associated protein [Geobacteraceae bacterium]|nr:MAG: transport-associated protein [Geobacteraceae bacterium]